MSVGKLRNGMGPAPTTRRRTFNAQLKALATARPAGCWRRIPDNLLLSERNSAQIPRAPKIAVGDNPPAVLNRRIAGAGCGWSGGQHRASSVPQGETSWPRPSPQWRPAGSNSGAETLAGPTVGLHGSGAAGFAVRTSVCVHGGGRVCFLPRSFRRPTRDIAGCGVLLSSDPLRDPRRRTRLPPLPRNSQCAERHGAGGAHRKVRSE